MKQLDITTFAGNKKKLITAVNAGANHIILEDSKFSIRSFTNDYFTSDFNKIHNLANLAKSINKGIKLSFNLDISGCSVKLCVLKKLIKVLKKNNIKIIRIQDPGLIILIKKYYPESVLYLSLETGNQNIESIRYYSNFFKRQLLCNLLPFSDIMEIKKNVNQLSELEIQVHGPILIQHSYRRPLAAWSSIKTKKEINPEIKTSNIISVQDNDHPEKIINLYDTPYGQFLYLYYDRCLIENIKELINLNLNSWLIDARGESDIYLKNSIKSYKSEFTKYLSSPETWQVSRESLSKLQFSARRPLNQGFFISSETDQVFKKIDKASSQEKENKLIGSVLDIIKEKNITIELFKPVKLSSTLLFISPEGRRIEYTVKQITDLSGNKIEGSGKHNLVQIKWKKGIVPKTKIFYS